jgi:glyoxylase-like metal-dependent hydrolase (beta-lactamase superfamily II)
VDADAEPTPMTPLPIAAQWFASTRVDDSLTLLWEPHVHPMLRCNIWHLRGRDSDLLIDTGLGVSSLRHAAQHLFERPLTVVLTHSHYDHVGGAHEFAECWVHAAEAAIVVDPTIDADWVSLLSADFPVDELELLADVGYPLTDVLIDHLPYEGYDPAQFRVRPVPVTHVLAEGDLVDVGDRAFEVLHLPGHSPGSIGLWESATGTLFSGDAIYDGPLLDQLPGSNIADYCATMQRLRQLPVETIHAGHDPSFGRDRLIEITTTYLNTHPSGAS